MAQTRLPIANGEWLLLATAYFGIETFGRIHQDLAMDPKIKIISIPNGALQRQSGSDTASLQPIYRHLEKGGVAKPELWMCSVVPVA